MDKAYWENYYKNTKFGADPSPFAKWFLENFEVTGKILELGCGNGRDSLFFAKKELDVIGIDQCETAIGELNNLGSSVSFIAADFTNLPPMSVKHVYSRFTLHSVDKVSANNTIKWASDNIQDGYFAIEVRSVLDPLCGVGELVDEDTWCTDHSRRFVRLEEIRNELIKNNFKILFEQEANGLAIYKEEDPVVIRIVASK